jgi:hypothetical protein
VLRHVARAQKALLAACLVLHIPLLLLLEIVFVVASSSAKHGGERFWQGLKAVQGRIALEWAASGPANKLLITFTTVAE